MTTNPAKLRMSMAFGFAASILMLILSGLLLANGIAWYSWHMWIMPPSPEAFQWFSARTLAWFSFIGSIACFGLFLLTANENAKQHERYRALIVKETKQE